MPKGRPTPVPTNNRVGRTINPHNRGAMNDLGNERPNGGKRLNPIPGSRMGAITTARKSKDPSKRLLGMPINAAGIDYQPTKKGGNWVDNKGRTFGTSNAEDGKINLKNPPSISGTRSRAYNTRLPEDQAYDSSGKKLPKTSSTSRQYALQRGNQLGLNVKTGKFGDSTRNLGVVKVTPLQKAAKARRLRS